METNVAAGANPPLAKSARRIPPEFNIFLVLVGIALVYEVLGWIFVGQSFLMNSQRLTIMILQVAVIGIIAVGVTQVIITGGIDVGAKAEIHRLITKLAGQGVAVIMISSEMPEVLGMSDRIMVMHEGRVTGFLDRAEASQIKVMELAAR